MLYPNPKHGRLKELQQLAIRYTNTLRTKGQAAADELLAHLHPISRARVLEKAKAPIRKID